MDGITILAAAIRFPIFLLFPCIGPCCGIVGVLTLVRPLRDRPVAKAVASVAIVAASMKFTWFGVFGGNMYLPEMPAMAILALSVVYDAVIMFAAIGIVVAFARAVARITRRHSVRSGKLTPPAGTLRIRRRDLLVGFLASATVPASVSAVAAGVRLPGTRRIELAFDDLPPAFDGYRIVQLSDLHVSAAARADRTEGVVRLVNALVPDLVVITGDIVDGTVRTRCRDVEPLGALSARDGILGCNGNHEYFRDADLWPAEFARIGIRILRNEATEIRRDRADGSGSDVISVIGQNDPISFDTDISSAAAASAPFRILLSHRPTGLAANAALGVRLQLSGHTHGGAAIGLDRLVARANEGHVRGLYREHGVVLYVNPGTGQWAGFPERIGVPTEITEILLRRSQPRS